KASLGVDGRGCRDRLALAGALDDGGFALGRPRLAVHRISSESRFIPEVDVGPALPGSRGDARVRFALPALDGLRIALVGALQRLLRRKTQTGQHPANSGDAQAHPELLLDQRGCDLPSPQAEIQTVL